MFFFQIVHRRFIVEFVAKEKHHRLSNVIFQRILVIIVGSHDQEVAVLKSLNSEEPVFVGLNILMQPGKGKLDHV